MGGDGGSIPRREDLVKSKKKPASANRDDANAALWRHCALTQDPLRQPVVSCLLGRLYNKESVITKLLSKVKVKGNTDHIRKLKDVRELRLTTTIKSTTEGTSSGQDTECFFCPITGLEMSGTHPFIYLWKCGCVFSKKAIVEVGDNLCMMCQTPFTQDEIILINPQSQEDVQIAHARLNAHQSVSSSKGSKRSITTDPSHNSDSVTSTHKRTEGTQDCDSIEECIKKKKKILNSEEKTITEDPQSDRQNITKSIQDDPGASNAYKSIFNTCDEAKRQQKSHWVTFNPLYFR